MRIGLVEFLTNHTGVLIAFIVVVYLARLATKGTARQMWLALLGWSVVVIGVTGFPFWQRGETLSTAQLVIASAASWAAICGLVLVQKWWSNSRGLP